MIVAEEAWQGGKDSAMQEEDGLEYALGDCTYDIQAL